MAPGLSRPFSPRAMPKSDTWPGGVATEPSSRNMDSAGSSDSVISTNSSFVSAAEQLRIFFLMGLLCGCEQRGDGEVGTLLLRMCTCNLKTLSLLCYVLNKL